MNDKNEGKALKASPSPTFLADLLFSPAITRFLRRRKSIPTIDMNDTRIIYSTASWTNFNIRSSGLIVCSGSDDFTHCITTFLLDILFSIQYVVLKVKINRYIKYNI